MEYRALRTRVKKPATDSSGRFQTYETCERFRDVFIKAFPIGRLLGCGFRERTKTTGIADWL
jgi:hypothetical protein